MKDKLVHINTINSILCMAEAAILDQTGIKMRLLIMNGAPKRKGTPEDLLTVIAASMEMMYQDYCHPSKRFEYSRLRSLGVHFLRVYFPKMSLKMIGEYMGGMDHSSIIYYLKKVQKLIDEGEQYFMQDYDNALTVITQWERE